jgi:UDP-N-acetylglucosamine 2-epimerase
MQHPVTTEYLNAKSQINKTIKAAMELVKQNYQILWLWPNIDAGSDIFSKEIRKFREKNKKIKNILFYKNFSPEEYAIILNNCSCIVGNSSSGIREASYLGIPSVNIGTRQNNREISKNVINVNYSVQEIVGAVKKQYNKKFKKSYLYGDGKAGYRMAKILSNCELDIKKELNYLKN